ncbi:NIPSNAP family containing protein [Candidatus Sulfopaludibacter sp. SbA3]|nr:NIPSNAP family containing protein [Candidatus Sulfopaludibacter sp. SbA3]
MIRKVLLLLPLLAGFAFAQNRVYELRTYTCNEGKLEALKTRFRDHTIEIFNRHHMESIGYWVPQDGDRSKNTLIYILAHPSREAAAQNWKEFVADPEWKKVSADSEANGKIVNHVESVFMDPADFSKLK